MAPRFPPLSCRDNGKQECGCVLERARQHCPESRQRHIDQILAQAANLGVAKDTLRRFKGLKQDAQANGFNVGLLADIWLLAIWFAILTVLLGRERQCEIVSWFPDRDSMTVRLAQ